MMSPLISCEQLAARLDDRDLCIVDCRHQLSDTSHGERVYAQGHIPGAVFMHLDRDLSGPMNGHNGRHPLPDPAVLARRLGAIGISRQTTVVVYDDAEGMVAGRLWWMLRWLGHERVAVLDGGFPRWAAQGLPLTKDLPSRMPTAFVADSPRDWVVDTTAVLANLDSREFLVIDARGADRFRGENETIDPVGGHIPGALSRPFRDNLNADGTFRPADELRQAYLDLFGGVPPEQVVMQCGSGVSACHNLIALELAGLPGARLYAGSWSEWCSDPARPVAR